MNIDLFMTQQSEAGLVCAGAFAHPVIGVILDAQTQEVTLEFEDGATFHLNIPVEVSYREKLLFAHRAYVGYLEDGLLTDAFEAPLLYLNDPYGSQFGDKSPLAAAKRSIIAFEQFMKRCSFAQALNRRDLGDEDQARSVLRGIDPQRLQYSPALQRQIQMNAQPRSATVPRGPGLGGRAAKSSAAVPAARDDDGKTDRGGDR